MHLSGDRFVFGRFVKARNVQCGKCLLLLQHTVVKLFHNFHVHLLDLPVVLNFDQTHCVHELAFAEGFCVLFDFLLLTSDQLVASLFKDSFSGVLKVPQAFDDFEYVWIFYEDVC